LLGGLTPLTKHPFVVTEERAALVNDTEFDAQVNDLARFADAAFKEHDVEFSFAERRGHLVLGHAHFGAVANGVATLLDALDTADVEAHTGIELERTSAARRLRRTKHYPYLFAQLVGEDHAGVRLLDRAGELTQRLAHQTCLQTDEGITHLA